MVPARLKPILLFLMVAGALVSVVRWKPMSESAATDRVPWRMDLSQARQEAARDGKPILAYFTATWCPPCREMKRTTWNDPAVEEALRGWIAVKIDVDQNTELARQFGVSSIPSLQIVGCDGVPGPALGGYVAPVELTSWLRSFSKR